MCIRRAMPSVVVLAVCVGHRTGSREATMRLLARPVVRRASCVATRILEEEEEEEEEEVEAATVRMYGSVSSQRSEDHPTPACAPRAAD